MKNQNKIFLIITPFIITLFFPHYLISQTKIISNLKHNLQNAKTEVEKLNVLFGLCDQSNSINPDSLKIFQQAAFTIATKLNNKQNILQAKYYEAVYLNKKGKLDSSEKIIQENEALINDKDSFFLKRNFELLQARNLVQKGEIKPAIEKSLNTLKQSEQRADSLGIIKSKSIIGWAYMELAQHDDALKWFFETYKLDSITNGIFNLNSLLANIASEYSNIKKYDSARIFADRAIANCQQKEDLIGLANAYFIKGYIDIAQNNPKAAEPLLTKGLEIRKQIGDPFYIVSDMFELSYFYSQNKQTEKGISMAKEAIGIAEKNNISEKIPILYSALAENYKSAGDLKTYSEILEKIITFKDSIYEKNKADALSELEAKYQLQKKENANVKLQLESANKDLWIFGSLGLLGLTIISGGLFLRYRRKKQLLNMQHLQMAEKQKTIQAVLSAEENERQRIASILHDSVAQKMVVTKLNLEAFEDELPKLDEEQKKSYENIYSMVDESFTEIRNLSHTMMPKEFYESGLVDALKSFFEKIDQRKMKINFNSIGNFSKVSTNTGFMVYRIVQECVQNTIKHAKATIINIHSLANESQLKISLDDNGVGFDIEEKNIKDGVGLSTVQNRIDYLNGKLNVQSQPGSGTSISFWVPIENN